jgi:hypothetical protein
MWKKLVKFLKEKVWEPVEDFFVGLWKEIVEWFKTPWTKFKKWFLETAIPWIKAGWMQVVNMLVLFIAYKGFDEGSQPGYSAVIGLWLFILLGYYIFWKLFGFDKVYKKMREERKNKK